MKVWDVPTRLFHWALAVLIALQFATGQFHFLTMEWHFYFGYATLALIVFRVLWGVFGSETARFSSFVRSPITAARYVRDTFMQREVRTVGHNPLGGYSVLTMLLLIGGQAITGLFTSDDISEYGPFAGHVSQATVSAMTRLHKLGQNLLLLLIAMHVLAVLAHAWFKREDLVSPMVHGSMRIDGVAPRLASAWLALALLAVSAALVLAIAVVGAA